jgi:hypothetical protein
MAEMETEDGVPMSRLYVGEGSEVRERDNRH